MTNDTAAARIRTFLKSAGLGTKQVSVKTERSGSVRVTILAASVGSAAVSEIASTEEKIRRCEASGEILQGGNTFVFVSHADDVREALVAEAVAAVHADVDAKGYGVWRGVQISKEGRKFCAILTGAVGRVLDPNCWTIEQAASAAASQILRDGVSTSS